MLNLITPEKRVEIVKNALKKIEEYTLVINISKLLLPFVRSNFEAGVSKGTQINLDFSDPALRLFTESFLVKYIDTTKLTLLLLKPEYLALRLGMIYIFCNASLKEIAEYFIIKDAKYTMFPTVDWKIEKKGICLLESNPLLYIGGDLNFCNPSRYFLDTRRATFSEPLTFIEGSLQTLPSDWYTGSNTPKMPAPRPPYAQLTHPGEDFLTSFVENEDEGIFYAYVRVVNPGQHISTFYSISDRLLKIQSLQVRKKIINFSNLIGDLYNPTVIPEGDLITKMFIFNKEGHSKVSFIGAT